MSKWKEVKISELCSLITDGTHQTPIYSNDGYIFLSSKNVTTGKIDWYNVKYIPKILHEQLYKRITPKKDDILLAKNGTTGIAAKVDKDIIFDIYVSLALLRPKEIIDADYFVFAINNPFTKRKFDKQLKGIGVPNLHLNSIKETRIPLPPLEEQHKIASILDTVSETLKLRKQQLNEADLLVKSKFVDMFGDPVENPMKWTSRYLNEVYEIIDGDRGVNYPKSNEFFEDGYCLFLNTGNVTKSGFCFEKTQFISEFKDSMLRKGKLQRYDIVLTTRGTVGNLAYYDEKIKFENIRINSGMVILRRKLECNPTFFINYFNISLSYINFMSGTAQPQMPIYLMRKLKVIYPPIELQNKFASFVQYVDKLKSEVQKSIDQLQTLFDSLMQQYFE